MEKQLPIDWLNDIPASRLFYDFSSYHWKETNWEFNNIRLFVIEIEDLLINKLGVADKTLIQNTERSRFRDFNDIEGIIDKLGCCYNSMEELEAWFRRHEINLMDYPNVYVQFSERLTDDGLYWPDGHI